MASCSLIPTICIYVNPDPGPLRPLWNPGPVPCEMCLSSMPDYSYAYQGAPYFRTHNNFWTFSFLPVLPPSNGLLVYFQFQTAVDKKYHLENRTEDLFSATSNDMAACISDIQIVIDRSFVSDFMKERGSGILSLEILSVRGILSFIQQVCK